MNAKKCILAATLTLLSPMFMSEVQASGEIKDGQCYGEDRARDAGPVRSIRFVVKPSSRRTSLDYSLQYTEWDVPNFVFDMSIAFCDRLSDHLIRCAAIGCDPTSRGHGNADYELFGLPDGRVLLNANGAYVGVEGQSKLIWQNSDESGLDLTGTFILKPIEDASCKPAEIAQRVELKLGDETTRVRSIESQLNKLGFLLEIPDNLYAPSTVDAVARFQRSYNLPDTGVVDGETEDRLRKAFLVGGGC